MLQWCHGTPKEGPSTPQVISWPLEVSWGGWRSLWSLLLDEKAPWRFGTPDEDLDALAKVTKHIAYMIWNLGTHSCGQDTYSIDDEVDKGPWYRLVTCLKTIMALYVWYAIESPGGLIQLYDSGIFEGWLKIKYIRLTLKVIKEINNNKNT